MNGFELTLSSDMLEAFCLRLSQTLLHFLWQGFFIGLLALGAARRLRRTSANTRYLANATALGLMAACLPITFAFIPMPKVHSGGSGVAMHAPTMDRGTKATGTPVKEFLTGKASEEAAAAERNVASFHAVYPVKSTSETDVTATNESKQIGTGNTAQAHWGGPVGEDAGQQAALPQTLSAWFQPWARYVAGIYLLGVIAMMLRVTRALWGGQRLRRTSSLIGEPWVLESIQVQARRIGLKAAPAVALCRHIVTPAVVGIFRPMILLPPSAITGLSPEELEALLMHELAHIRRYDLLVNLLQRLVEAVLFFHPAIWYVSRRLNIERENCCDDLVLWAGFPRLRYADALVHMAELYVDSPMASETALTASAGKGPTELKQRVLRLLEPARHAGPRLHLTRSGVLCFVALWVTVMLGPAALENWSGNRSSVEAGQTEESPLDRAALLALARQDRFQDGTVVTLDPIHGTITGRGGRPVVAATVHLREHPRSWKGGGRSTPTETRDLAVTVSDDQGRFRFENVKSQPLHVLRKDVLPVDVVVLAEGYAAAWRRLSECGAADFQLKLASKVHGRVLNKKGKPAVGTTVRVLRFLPLTEIANMELARHKYPRTVGNTLDLAYADFQIAATVDAQGEFVLPGLPKDSGVVLEVNDPRYYCEFIYTTANPEHPVWRESAHVSKPAPSSYVVPPPYGRFREDDEKEKQCAEFGLRESVQTSPIEITLHRGIRLRVRVMDDQTGAPISGARLPESLFTYPGRGMTDENGVYEYTQLKSGYLSLTISPPEGSKWVTARMEVELAEEVHEAEVRLSEVELSRGAVISGRVVDRATGRGIGDVLLRHIVHTGHTSANAAAKTNQDGRFHIVGHPGEGQVILYSAVPGYETPIRSGSIHQAPERFKRSVNATLDTPQTDIVFEIDPDALFHGRTLDPQGKPIGGVKITGQKNRRSTGGGFSYMPIELESHSDGRFVLMGLYADVLQKRRPRVPILFRDEARGLAVRVVFSPPTDDTKTIEKDIQLQPASTITGRVINDQTNGPVVGASIGVSLLTGNSGRHIGGTKTDQQGRYSYRGLVPDEEHTVSIRAKGYVISSGGSIYSKQITMKAGGTRTMPDVHMQPVAVAESTAAIPKAEAPNVAGQSPEKALETLLRRFEEDRAAYSKRLDATKYRNERKKIFARQEPTGAYSKAFETLAKENPGSDVELKSLIWICNARTVVGADSSDLRRRKEEAAQRLLEKYIDRKEIVDCLGSLVYRSGKPHETARFLMEKSPHREVQGRACLLTAQVFERDLDMANRSGRKPSEKARQEAITFYRQVVAEYADILDWRHGTIGKQAEKALNELENLWIGELAPDIVGEDLDGKPLKLSDYRGKIVVLAFTSQIKLWTTLARTMAEFDDDQVVVLGVYDGPDREAARKTAGQNGIPWRIWFDGPDKPGPIVSAWNNTSWPNAHVLDQEGVIRYRNAHNQLPAAIEALWPEPE